MDFSADDSSSNGWGQFVDIEDGDVMASLDLEHNYDSDEVSSRFSRPDRRTMTKTKSPSYAPVSLPGTFSHVVLLREVRHPDSGCTASTRCATDKDKSTDITTEANVGHEQDEQPHQDSDSPSSSVDEQCSPSIQNVQSQSQRESRRRAMSTVPRRLYSKCIGTRRRQHEVLPTPVQQPLEKKEVAHFESPESNFNEAIILFLIKMHPKATTDASIAARLKEQFEKASPSKQLVVLRAAVNGAKQQGRQDLLDTLDEGVLVWIS